MSNLKTKTSNKG